MNTNIRTPTSRNMDCLIKTYLRTDIETLFARNTGQPIHFDYSAMRERKAKIIAFKQNVGSTRRKRSRFNLARRVLGIRHVDLNHSPSLQDFVENGPIKARVIPKKIFDKIQQELWDALYPNTTRAYRVQDLTA